jgi:hypothetical protein
VVKSNYSFKGEPLMLRRADNGRLEPISGEQQAEVEAETSGDTARTERAAKKETERESRLLQRAAKEDELRAKRAAEKAEAQRKRDEADVEAVKSILKSGFTGKLRVAVRSRLGCGADRADLAIARATTDEPPFGS